MCKDCGCGQESMRARLDVEGMTCSHCKESVEKALLPLPGVLSAQVNLEEKWAQVDFDGTKTSLDDLRQAVEAIGFDVVGTEVQEVGHHYHGVFGMIRKLVGKD